MKTIALYCLSKHYGRNMALKELSIVVEEGEIYGFIGPNGAGKSTTIRLLFDFIRPDSGNISVMGYAPAKDDIKIKQLTGYVSAETFMYPDMKVKDLFRFTESYYKKKAGERIKKLIEILDIDTSKRFDELSFGNRKKVSVACALMHSPKLLVLDEPSNGLDPVIRSNLYELLKEENKNGVTIFFSSHVLHEVQKFCTKIGMIKEGKLIREALAAEFTNLGYRNVKIETKAKVDLERFKGVTAIERQGDSIQFMYSGSANELISFLKDINIASIHIEEPELESVFMNYFK
jgi:ABC-2 type transport system ATP-binding protein